MISKEEAKARLKKAGYSVVDDNSVLTIVIPEKGNIKNTVKAVKELFLKIDYNASFGVKQSVNGGESSAEDSIEDEDNFGQGGLNDDNSLNDNLLDISADDVHVVDASEAKEITETEKKVAKSKSSNISSKQIANKENMPGKDEEDYFDEEDDLDSEGTDINLNSLDMDMLLNEDSIQFSLEDFGMM